MKKIAYVCMVMLLLVSLAAPAFAGGDQNCGDKGQGSVVQHQCRY